MNAEKSFFARNELEYLGLKIPSQGIMPLPDKIEAIKNIAVPAIKTSFQSLKSLIINIKPCGNIDLILK